MNKTLMLYSYACHQKFKKTFTNEYFDLIEFKTLPI